MCIYDRTPGKWEKNKEANKRLHFIARHHYLHLNASSIFFCFCNLKIMVFYTCQLKHLILTGLGGVHL